MNSTLLMLICISGKLNLRQNVLMQELRTMVNYNLNINETKAQLISGIMDTNHLSDCTIGVNLRLQHNTISVCKVMIQCLIPLNLQQ